MLTDNVGLKYGYNVTDMNKTNTGVNTYSRMTREALSANLDDTQVIVRTSSANEQNAQGSYDNANSKVLYERGRFDPESSIISEEVSEYSPQAQEDKKTEKKAKQEYYNKIFGNTDVKNEAVKKQAGRDEMSEHALNKHDGFEKDCPLCDCETCRNRRYQDDSGDSAVSFQQPTQMNPQKAASMVKSHEMEHVRREQHKAKEDGKRIVSQSVQIKTDICPECGKTYVSGGLTRTRTRDYNPEFINLFKVGAEDITTNETV